MRVLLLHNRYQQAGGEDAVVRSEKALLESRGDDVTLFEADNDAITGLSAQVRAAVTVTYSRKSRRQIAAIVRGFRPDIVHVHNFFPVLSPSIYYACAEAGVPTVQTLHNYRLLCPNALLFRDGRVCETCVAKTFKYPGVLKGCYRGSKAGTLAVATMTAVHTWAGTWAKMVDRYIVLTKSQRSRFIRGGFPAEKLIVKPNFVSPDPGSGAGDGGFVLFVGRLSAEKGIDVLLRAWDLLGSRVPLKIIGTGPLVEECRNAVGANAAIECLGPRPASEVYEWMGKAQALVFSSTWHEPFGRTIVESFAKGTPVIGSKTGSVEELIAHGRTGLHFTPGDAGSLVQQIEWMLAHPGEWKQMRAEARAEYEAKYTAEQNYAMMMEICRQAIASRQSQSTKQ